MAMNQVPGQNIYIGGIICLKNKAALARADITHVVSVLRLNQADDTFAPYQHLAIDVDDVDDDNLLEHLPTAVKFIQAGLDGGGGVLVHCAMGKSRSATVCIAYLLHQQPGALTPQSALEILRQSRPLCEPNDGFMQQLELYYEMGCPDDVTEHPLYRRWLYRRDVEESVACGRAPEMRSVRFEDEHSPKSQIDSTGRTEEIKCRKCRRTLATSPFIIPHDPKSGYNPRAQPNMECAHIFLHPLKWMRPSLFPASVEDGADPDADSTYTDYASDAPLSGRLTCPNPGCGANVGKFAWQGMQCSCGGWVVPAIGLAKARVDIANRMNSTRGSGVPQLWGFVCRQGCGEPKRMTRTQGGAIFDNASLLNDL
ncbi:hypothetical protein N7462_009322 [Penicillium macrosclerotiorum]|uniref:uncharacterized protein n=1 Tax=Penicillium macrosclerotiorum TaxID=303699 RepID=UPI00254929D0|nr:uncharacterized protein N7462_009322 [Penicillium macrosclerotiorum]KAJ5673883.1 hypothetical protein N7462_009322 [Penicillium macrosclerotiorum]